MILINKNMTWDNKRECKIYKKVYKKKKMIQKN